VIVIFNTTKYVWLIIVLIGLLLACNAKDNIPPRVIATNPQNGAQDVDPSLKEISVTFSEPMMDKSWSWCYEIEEKFPQMTGEPKYIENNTRNLLPVKLESNKEYVIWINTEKFNNFKDEAGNTTEPYRFTFRTK